MNKLVNQSRFNAVRIAVLVGVGGWYLGANGEPVGFSGLGDLPGGNAASRILYGRAMSADGNRIVGSAASANGDWEAFFWERGVGMTALGDLAGGAFHSLSTGISRDGDSVVGLGTMSDTAGRSFIWYPGLGGSITNLGFGMSSDIIQAFACSDDGDMIPGSVNCSLDARAAAKTGGNWRKLYNDGSCGYGWGESYSCDASGSILCGTLSPNSSDGPFQPFGCNYDSGMDTFSAELIMNIGEDNETTYGIAYDCTSGEDFDHAVFVGQSSSESGPQASVTGVGDMTFIGLGDLAGGEFNSAAYGTNDTVNIVAGYGTSESGREAVIWLRDPNNEYQLFKVSDVLENQYQVDLSDWDLQEACSVTIVFDQNDQTLVIISGNGIHYPGIEGVGEVWRAVIGHPCPADHDQSGSVDSNDYDAFSIDFALGEPITDFDRSGFVDTDDFNAYVVAFTNGC